MTINIAISVARAGGLSVLPGALAVSMPELNPEWLSTGSSLAIRVVPALLAAAAGAVPGLLTKRRDLEWLEADPAALRGDRLREARSRMEATVKFLDIRPFYNFISITLATCLIIFFGNYFPGFVALAVVAGVFGWHTGMSMAMSSKAVRPRVLVWLGDLYLREQSWRRLELVVDRLLSMPAANKLDAGWLRANLLFHAGEAGEAIEVLTGLPPSPRNDAFLFKMLADKGDFLALEKRCFEHKGGKATELLRSMPESTSRDIVLARVLEREGKWPELSAMIEDMRPEEAIAVIESLPPSPRRDRGLILLYHQAEDLDAIAMTLDGYGLEEGEKLILERLPAGERRDEILMAHFGGHGRYGRVRELAAGRDPSGPIKVLMDLPRSEDRDRVLVELLAMKGDAAAILDLFEKSGDDPLSKLESIESGKMRELVRGHHYVRTFQAEEAIKVLEPLHAAGELGRADVLALAESYRGTGRTAAAIDTLMRLAARDITDQEVFRELCDAAMSGEAPADLLDKALGPLEAAIARGYRPEAETLWALIEYYKQFEMKDHARRAAEIMAELHGDPRARLLVSGDPEG